MYGLRTGTQPRSILELGSAFFATRADRTTQMLTLVLLLISSCLKCLVEF